MAHDHDHHQGHHHHHHVSSGRMLLLALLLTLGFAFVELVAGWWAGSLALMGDAGHMATDATALGLAALAAWFAAKPPSHTHSYGLIRAEVVAALINGLFMLVVVAGIVGAAWQRLQAPVTVDGGSVMLVAAIGLVINGVVAWLLSRGEDNLNVRAALLHVLADMLGSVAALVSGLVIFISGWTLIDPILSLLICALILFSTFRLFRDVFNVIMEAVPAHVNLQEVGLAMAAQSGVREVHDLHIWSLASGQVALSAHVVVERLDPWPDVLFGLQQMLEERFAIAHVTLQPELPTQEVVSLEDLARQVGGE